MRVGTRRTRKRVSGVEPGEWIVIAGVEYLREGQKVRFGQ